MMTKCKPYWGVFVFIFTFLLKISFTFFSFHKMNKKTEIIKWSFSKLLLLNNNTTELLCSLCNKMCLRVMLCTDPEIRQNHLFSYILKCGQCVSAVAVWTAGDARKKEKKEKKKAVESWGSSFGETWPDANFSLTKNKAQLRMLVIARFCRCLIMNIGKLQFLFACRATGKVRGSPQSWGLIFWDLWMFLQYLALIHLHNLPDNRDLWPAENSLENQRIIKALGFNPKVAVKTKLVDVTIHRGTPLR